MDIVVRDGADVENVLRLASSNPSIHLQVVFGPSVSREDISRFESALSQHSNVTAVVPTDLRRIGLVAAGVLLVGTAISLALGTERFNELSECAVSGLQTTKHVVCLCRDMMDLVDRASRAARVARARTDFPPPRGFVVMVETPPVPTPPRQEPVETTAAAETVG